MRELKFRFWNKTLRRMSAVYGLGLIWEHLCEEWDVFDWKDVEKLQYTGLTDKDDAEIYEWDIVEVHRGMDGQEDIWRITIEDIRNLPRELSGSNLISRTVIGNVYENPELKE